MEKLPSIQDSEMTVGMMGRLVASGDRMGIRCLAGRPSPEIHGSVDGEAADDHVLVLLSHPVHDEDD